jgi:hypothetical protein
VTSFRSARGADNGSAAPPCGGSSIERVNGSALIGLALILLGVALGSGSLRLRRRRDVPAATGTTPTT